MKELQILLDEINHFQVTTFPKSDAMSKLVHLSKEVVELFEELAKGDERRYDNKDKIEMEYADCFLLLFGSAGAHGLNAEDIARIIREKLEINRNRKWGKPDEDGVVLHIKE